MLLFSIVSRGNNSSEQKLKAVSEKYYMDIYKYCVSRLVIDISYADDMTNNVFELLCKKWTVLENKNYRSWLYETADNLLKNFYKKHKRRLENETRIDDMRETLSYEQDFESIDEYAVEKYKDEIMESLTEQERELFELAYIEKLPRVQISEKLSVNEKTLEKRLYRLRQKIKGEVTKKLEQAGHK